MDSVSSAGNSSQVMSDLLRSIATQNTELAKKLVRANIETALSVEPGKGANVDISA